MDQYCPKSLRDLHFKGTEANLDEFQKLDGALKMSHKKFGEV
jgi:hypothetical protein